MNIIEEILNKDFKDYSVFSANYNSLHFDYAKDKILAEILNEPIFVCKKHFEELIVHNTELQKEYVQQLYSDNLYYILQKMDGSIAYDFYIIVKDTQITMFFIRQSF